MQLHRLRSPFTTVPTAYDDYRIELSLEPSPHTAVTAVLDAPFLPAELDFFAAGDDLDDDALDPLGPLAAAA